MSKSVWLTGIAIANSMIGSSMVIFPLNFNQWGIIENTIIVCVMSCVMALTCKLFVGNIRPYEKDITDSIKRRLGPTFLRLFGIISASTVFFVASVFYLLASDILYDVFIDLLGSSFIIGEKIFKIIVLGCFALSIFAKNLQFVFKMTPIALGALLLSVGALIASFPLNLENISAQTFRLKGLGITEILTIISINEFAFLCHPSVSPIIKQNKNQAENSKAVYIGYGITLLLYLAVGIIGSLAIHGFHPVKKNNVMDYFSGSWQAPFIGILNFLYFFLIVPIFPFVAKSQIYDVLPQKVQSKITNYHKVSSIIYTALWIPMNLLFVIFETSPVAVISFLGSVMCYYTAYFLPVYMTIKSADYLINQTVLTDSLIVPDCQDNQVTKQELRNEKQGFSTDKIPRVWQKGIYIFVLILGAVLLVSQFVSYFI